MHLSDSRTASSGGVIRISAAEAVLTDLRSSIERGDLAVGAKLPSETALASRFGVSRSVVREALRSCQTLGLTRTQTGKGTFVIADQTWDLAVGNYSGRDLLEARPHIEVPAAGLAAMRRSPEQLAELEQLTAQMRSSTNRASWFELDVEFHAAIALASGNKVFQSTLAGIRDALARQAETLNIVGGRKQASDMEHSAIVRAIVDGSQVAAERAMHDHLDAVRQTVETVLHAAEANEPT